LIFQLQEIEKQQEERVKYGKMTYDNFIMSKDFEMGWKGNFFP
jgi:hypothetical protein